VGRDRNVADIPLDHASISNQHAILQFRQIVKVNDFGEIIQKIKLLMLLTLGCISLI
jgi:smad nuclear-interacting protein 1